jgi:chromosome segregation ATPase
MASEQRKGKPQSKIGGAPGRAATEVRILRRELEKTAIALVDMAGQAEAADDARQAATREAEEVARGAKILLERAVAAESERDALRARVERLEAEVGDREEKLERRSAMIRNLEARVGRLEEALRMFHRWHQPPPCTACTLLATPASAEGGKA